MISFSLEHEGSHVLIPTKVCFVGEAGVILLRVELLGCMPWGPFLLLCHARTQWHPGPFLLLCHAHTQWHPCCWGKIFQDPAPGGLLTAL